MNVKLEPELERFIDDQVKAGHFPSADAAIAAAVDQMRADTESISLTDEDWSYILESDRQIERGECVDFDVFAAEMRKRYGCE